MRWEGLVEEWEQHPVTRAFKAEVKKDMEQWMNELVYEKSPRKTEIVKGMIRALRAVLDMGVTDPILNPEQVKEQEDVSRS